MLCFLIISQNVFFLFLSYQSLWKAHQFGFCPHHNWSMRSAMTSTLPNLGQFSSPSCMTHQLQMTYLTILLPGSRYSLEFPCLLCHHILLFFLISKYRYFQELSSLSSVFSLFSHCVDYLIHLMFLNTMFTLMTVFIILWLPVLVLRLLFLYL